MLYLFDEKKEESKLVEKLKKALGDSVKDVVISDRLSADSAAVIVMDENDPSIQMQKILKQMGRWCGLDDSIKTVDVKPDKAPSEYTLDEALRLAESLCNQ